MKELSITKGEAIKYLKENICKDTMLPNDVDFNTTNGYLASEMMSAFTREKNSELLQRYNEAIEALEQIKDLCKPSNQNEFAIKSIAEQTISKAKP
jgi:hypothetical protein